MAAVFPMRGAQQFGVVDKADENRMREITHEYLKFLDDSADEQIYYEKIIEMIRENNSRLIVNINDVRRKISERAVSLLKNFVEEIVCFEQALKEVLAKIDAEFSKNRSFCVGFEGSFGDRHVNPRSLKAAFLGNMVCCEGIVTRCSLVRPKIVKSLHYCPATKKTLEKKYTDFTSYEAFPTSNAYPKEDENKNPLETEFGKCVYKDHQVFSIQELPESAPAGNLPRNIDVIADDDLADRCKPGDRVRVIALFRVLPNKQAGMSTGNFRSVLIANNIQLMSKELEPNFEQADITEMRRMSRHKGIFELLARSLAPSICGHDEVKKAILCLLLGGSEKILENGTRLRGDINVLLIGDPSVAKSQMLRYVIHTAPRVIATTGRGSSGVGLTAAVVHDSDTGERRLEAGAMVLADRGIVCIDEFDKMTDIDRTAIHEVMEQGRVSISKGGIHAKLNARCSVLSAANPVFGRYDLSKSPMENIGMQDSLLSRFDLIFVLLDEHDVAKDRTVAENVLKLHRFRPQGEPVGTVLPIGNNVELLTTFDPEQSDDQGKVEVYEKSRDWTAVKAEEKILTTQFMRKYIHMAKDMRPTLSEGASEYISERYAELRSTDLIRNDRERTMPFTARQLETMIRLSTAMAKARLSKTVEMADAEKAFELLHFACFKEKPKERLETEQKKKRQKDGGQETESEDEMETGETLPTADTSETRPIRYAKRRGATTLDEAMETEEEEESSADPTNGTSQESQSSSKRARIAEEVPAISVDRYKKFKALLRKAFDDSEVPLNETAELGQIMQSIQHQAGSQRFTEAELKAACEQISAENIVFINEEDDQILLL